MQTVFCAELVAAIGPGAHAGAPGNKVLACDRCNTDKRAATRLLRGCIGPRRLAIRGRPSPGDRWHRRCPSKSARCSPSPPPSQTASWLRPRSRRRRNDVGGLIIIGNIRGEPLAIDVSGEQTLNIGKAGQIAQNVAPSPGSAFSSVTSAHDVTR